MGQKRKCARCRVCGMQKSQHLLATLGEANQKSGRALTPVWLLRVMLLYSVATDSSGTLLRWCKGPRLKALGNRSCTGSLLTIRAVGSRSGSKWKQSVHLLSCSTHPELLFINKRLGSFECSCSSWTSARGDWKKAGQLDLFE